VLDPITDVLPPVLDPITDVLPPVTEILPTILDGTPSAADKTVRAFLRAADVTAGLAALDVPSYAEPKFSAEATTVAVALTAIFAAAAAIVFAPLGSPQCPTSSKHAAASTAATLPDFFRRALELFWRSVSPAGARLSPLALAPSSPPA
jgi:hypothetical protein